MILKAYGRRLGLLLDQKTAAEDQIMAKGFTMFTA